MNPIVIFTGYLEWHYTKAFVDIITVWSNFFWFIGHYFSIKLLLRTLFSPWKRMHENYGGQGIEDFFASLVINIISRFIGAVIRLAIIAIGIFSLLLAILGAAFFFIFWVCAPIILVILLITTAQYFL